MGKILIIKGADFSAVAVGTVTPITGKVAITVVASPAGGGTVTGSGSYDEGSTVTITATAKSGYDFSQWSDGNTNASRQITVGSSAKTYTATFVVHQATSVEFTKIEGDALVSNDASKFGPIGTLFAYDGFGIYTLNVNAGDVIRLTGVTPTVGSVRWGLFNCQSNQLVIGTSVAYQSGNLVGLPDSFPKEFTATQNGCLVLTPSGSGFTWSAVKV